MILEAPVDASLGAMGSLLGKLDLVLAPGCRLPRRVMDGMHLLKDDVEELGVCLEDLSDVEDPPPTAKYWIKEARELIYDIEDYTNSFVLDVTAKIKTTRFLCKISHVKINRLSKRRKQHNQMVDIISEFRMYVKEAIERYERYELKSCSTFSRGFVSVGPMLPTPYEATADIVIDGRTSEFISSLASDGDRQLKVVSVLGSGCLGKTTLAKLLYGKFAVQFDCRAFIRVSKKPDMKRLFHDLLSLVQRPKPIVNYNEVDITNNIRKHLKDKRYLIIIDGLCAVSVWDIIKYAFPKGDCGSRIITTTKFEDVALACCCYHSEYVFELKPLDDDHSRKLFFNQLFGSESECPEEFKELSNKIVELCGGLPLAIISTASILARQPTISIDLLAYIHHSLSSCLPADSTSERTRQVLNLSYNNLPHHLKACLLYLSMYPEGYTICKEYLVKQWMAEGFIHTTEGQDMEKVAGSYFNELIDRRFIEPICISYNNEVLSCAVHDEVHDFIADKCAEENFIVVIGYNRNIVALAHKVRRLSLLFGDAKYAKIPANITTSQVRSLTFFGLFKCIPCITEFKLLRVLNLQLSGHRCHDSINLTGICELFHLRYLKIACDVCIQLPNDMQALQFLETLDAMNTRRVTAVPHDIIYLPHLLHLSLPVETNLLYWLGRNVVSLWSLGKLKDLQDLHLACSSTLPSGDLEALSSLLGRHGNLKTLTLVPGPSDKIDVVHGASKLIISWDGFVPPLLLQRFECSLHNCIFYCIPKWIEQLGNLCILKIAVSELLMNSINILRGLPSLTALSLYVQTAPVERIIFDKVGFSVLNYFKFRCTTVPWLTFEAGAMPHLQKLNLCFGVILQMDQRQHGTGLIRIEHLPGLKVISTKIGDTGSDVASLLTTTISNHLSNPRIDVRLIDYNFYGDESTKQKTQLDEYDKRFEKPADIRSLESSSPMHVPAFDINVLLKEARSRWLKPSEVYHILQNHERLKITPEPPKKPPSGSLFLYNRRVNRFFRKDGYAWRRKKDGRTVGEAHERLKVGNVDALSCYYAHGEQNPCFQRRCFWMLEPAYDHIVLVQYREVSEGRYYSTSLSNESAVSLSTSSYPNGIDGNQYYGSTSFSDGSESHQSYPTLSSITEVSSDYNSDSGILLSIPEFEQSIVVGAPELGQTSLERSSKFVHRDNNNLTYTSGLGQALKSIEEQLSLGDDDDDYIYVNHMQPLGFATNIEAANRQRSHTINDLGNVPGDNQANQMRTEGNQNDVGKGISPSWENVMPSNSDSPALSTYQTDVHYQRNSEYQPPGALGNNELQLQLSAAERFLLGPEESINSPSYNFIPRDEGINGIDSISAHDSSLQSYMNPNWERTTPVTLKSNVYDSKISEPFLDNGQFEHSSREATRLSLAQKQQFRIREISPEWAFCYEITKVIITGDFLCDSPNSCLAVMFGDNEVPVEIVQPGVLRCHTPLHSSGKLTLCITSGNREVCSQVKDFEFREKSMASSFTDLTPSSRSMKSSEELSLLAKFARMLLCQDGNSVVPDSDSQSGMSPKIKMNDEHWQRLIDELKVGCENPLSMVDWIMEELLKSNFQRWLSAKLQGNDGTSSLSKHEQGLLHLISALGYEWALSSVLNAGVGINLRDSNGWTALHWAAYFGREKMVAALLAAGASAPAVTDPTAQDPVGKTAAFLASERGHRGLAGYLSEVSLTSYLASLTIEESDITKGSAAVEAERAVASISQRSAQLHGGTEDELSLKDSLAAVRNAAQAAARIQNAFRAFSFRKRQEKDARLKDEYGMTQEDIDELALASRSYNKYHVSNDRYCDKAAVSIQKKYRGWKGRKKFLNMRRNVVKIQAHVRGHQVRKKYKTFVSTVSVLEKVILRWRRKGHGLRGFRAEQPAMIEAEEEEEEEEDDDDFDDDEAVKIFRRQKVDQSVKEAVSRVLSMVDSPEARRQYRRMLEEFRQATAELGASDEAISILDDDLLLGINNFMF